MQHQEILKRMGFTELNFEGKRIIRPAYRCVVDEMSYVPLEGR